MWRGIVVAVCASGLTALVAACGAAKTVRTTTYTVPSSAMEPTLHCARGTADTGCEANTDDRIVVEAVANPRRGNIIVFRTPPNAVRECGAGGTFVKRLIGLPGDRIRERNGWFFINGKRLDDSSYIRPARRDVETGFWKVPKGEYFFVGDNRSRSCDSRKWGSVPRFDIIGKVVAIERPSGEIKLG